jgi:Domain of unknown function (DUF4349)
MPDLEMLLRDVRPAPDPAWAARLDTKAAQGFPRPPAAWKRPLIALREHLFAFGALASAASVAIVLIIVVANADLGGSDDSASATSAKSASPAMEQSTDSAGGGGAAGPSRDALGITGQARPVKKTTAITLTTTPDEVQSVSDRAIRVVDRLGGYVDSSETSITGSRAEATLSLRIPADKLDDGLAQLSKLAHVSARSQQTEDLTDQRAYLESRVRDARADREGLRTRLQKATTDKERARLRAQLDRATRRVTQRERAVAALGQEAAFGTVDLTITGRKRSGAVADKPGDRWTPGDALDDAGRVLEVIAGVLLIALAVLIPVAAVAALAWLANRGLTRRKRLRALEMA